MIKLNVDNIANWILVTGVIRSGTTFVGKVLSHPLAVDYLHEPFNGGYSLPDRKPFQPRYVRPEADGEAVRRYREHVARIFSYDFGLTTARHPRDPWYMKAAKTVVGSRGPFYLRLARVNPFHRAAILKDPTAKLPAEFLYTRFGVTPVIVVRHPVSLAASLRRMGWYPEVKDFARQPHLVEDYFAGDTAFLQREWPSRFLESMGHWRASYKVLLTQADRYDWPVVTHEKLCRHPLQVFRRLYRTLELPWSEAVARKVRRLTRGNGSAKARKGQAMDLQRDSARIFEMRRDEIPREERRAIFEIVEDVALTLYSRESFAIETEP